MISIEQLPTENILMELNLRKKSGLINCSPNHNNGNIEPHPDSVSKTLDIHLNRYENVILLDFNEALKILL